MKTSNILLTGFLIVILLLITWFIGTAKYYFNTEYVELSGTTITESRETEPFTKLSVQGKFDVTVKQGAQRSIEIIADENVMPEVITEVKGNELTVRLQNRIRDRKRIKVNISMESIEALSFSAGTVFSTEGEISGDQLNLDSFAGSEGNVILSYDKVRLNSQAGSSIRIKGNATEIQIESSAGSDIKAGDLKVDKCTVNGSAGSSVVIYVNEELTASLSAGASLNYYGNPTIKNFQTFAGGSINKMD